MLESNTHYREEHSKIRGMQSVGEGYLGGPTKKVILGQRLQGRERVNHAHTQGGASKTTEKSSWLSVSSIWHLEKPQWPEQSEQGGRSEENEIRRRWESRMAGCPGHREGFGHPALECRAGLSPLCLSIHPVSRADPLEVSWFIPTLHFIQSPPTLPSVGYSP